MSCAHWPAATTGTFRRGILAEVLNPIERMGHRQCAWHHSPPDSMCTPTCSTSAGDLNWILPPNPSKCSPSCLLDFPQPWAFTCNILSILPLCLVPLLPTMLGTEANASHLPSKQSLTVPHPQSITIL